VIIATGSISWTLRGRDAAQSHLAPRAERNYAGARRRQAAGSGCRGANRSPRGARSGKHLSDRGDGDRGLAPAAVARPEAALRTG
jgi:hypothetical protein